MLLLEQLKQIPDHRGVQGRKYPLWVLIILLIIGKLCGHDGYRPIADFCQKYRQKLWSLLDLELSMPSPSYSTFRRTMINVNYQHWEEAFNTWAIATMPEQIGRCSSIDGKSIKCTSEGGQTSEQDFVSIVSVYNHENAGVMQLKVMHNKKVSEIKVAKDLIEKLKDLPSRQCFSLDALHTQTKTVKQIRAVNHDYLIAVKKNQPKLYQTLEGITQNSQALSAATSQDNTHGRQVQRQVEVFTAPIHLQQKWEGLKTLIRVERSGKRQQQDFQEVAYYLSSQELGAQVFLKDIQGHWSIENQLHWVKDVTFQEDNPPRIGGYAPVNWAILFSWFITLARRAKVRTVPQARRLWANQIDELFALLL